MPLLPLAARADLHFGEEPIISGTKGSGTIFFSGCSLNCVYCQNYEISRENNGKLISIERLTEIFKELEEKGAHNINLVNPTHYVYAIKEALDLYRPNIPIVYNSGGYDSLDSLKMLEGYIDVYLMDFKYFDNDRAKKYSNAENYPEIAKNAILEAIRQQPKCIIENGVMKKGVIIRHLLLPRGTNDAIRIFNWVEINAYNAYFSIMSQYTPFGNLTNTPEINRKVTNREYNKVLDYICESDFKNVFIQERESATKEYIPTFDFFGI